MIDEVRTELRLAVRSFVLPVFLVLAAVFAILNVVNTSSLVQSDYALVQHTRAEYAANHMDFAADLRKPVVITKQNGGESISNLARYDYDTMVAAKEAISPASTVPETLKYFGFVIFPAIFFLLGLWMLTSQRRHHLEKATLVRAGTVKTIAARQVSLLVCAIAIIAVVELVDVIARSIAQAVLAHSIPFAVFEPLSAQPVQDSWAQWGVILVVVLFFGWGGIAVGAFAGVFAVPGIVFLGWDFIVPILGPNDPRNWFIVLAHGVFRYDAGFQLAPSVSLALPLALSATLVTTIALAGLGYLGIRIRNPLAT